MAQVFRVHRDLAAVRELDGVGPSVDVFDGDPVTALHTGHGLEGSDLVGRTPKERLESLGSKLELSAAKRDVAESVVRPIDPSRRQSRLCGGQEGRLGRFEVAALQRGFALEETGLADSRVVRELRRESPEAFGRFVVPAAGIVSGRDVEGLVRTLRARRKRGAECQRSDRDRPSESGICAHPCDVTLPKSVRPERLGSHAFAAIVRRERPTGQDESLRSPIRPQGNQPAPRARVS